MQITINEQKFEQCSNTQHHKKLEPQFDNRICTKFVKIKSENLRSKRWYRDKTQMRITMRGSKIINIIVGSNSL
jgi:hypothetical protein